MLWLIGLTVVLYVMIGSWIEFGFIATIFTLGMIAALMFYGLGIIDSVMKKISKRFNSAIDFVCGGLSR